MLDVPLELVVFVFSCIKLLLVYCYHSTDFEVHRNWLAITYSLPPWKWYYEGTSEWTLDYPPFFGWFEYLLSLVAVMVDKNIVILTNLNYNSFSVICFQRLTVIVTDLLFAGASIALGHQLSRWLNQHRQFSSARSTYAGDSLSLLLILNGGLFIVDHMHFQYNGFLCGVLLWSVVCLFSDRWLLAGFLFATLLNLKHIYLYLAPAYFAYMLRGYCLRDGLTSLSRLCSSISRTGQLAFVVVMTFGLSFGPFVYWKSFLQVISRLFPFKRGLTHAYWAPNMWALYNFGDYAMLNLLKLVNKLPNATSPGYITGLVQEFDHVVLPTISPGICLALTLLAVLPFVTYIAMVKRDIKSFLRLMVLCAFASFSFGWHVHEKAILLVIIPQTILACMDRHEARIFLLLSTIGHYSLFPLIFTATETPLKYGVMLLYCHLAFSSLSQLHFVSETSKSILNRIEQLFLFGLVLLEVYCQVVHKAFGLNDRFPFIPLMLTSVYCAIGIGYCWTLSIVNFVSEELGLDLWFYKRILWTREQGKLKKLVAPFDTEEWQKKPDETCADCQPSYVTEAVNCVRLTEAGKKLLRKKHHAPCDDHCPPFAGLKYIGGMDISHIEGDDSIAVACLVILSWPSLEVVKTVSEVVVIDVPYVPGFLAFREAPSLVKLMKQLKKQCPTLYPDVLMIDGNGLLHPNSCGLACHIGTLLDVPTIGIAKNLHLVDGLIKNKQIFHEDLKNAGDFSILVGQSNNELGAALRTSQGAKNPIFVSIGHRTSLLSAVKLVLACSLFRIPEPTRQVLLT